MQAEPTTGAVWPSVLVLFLVQLAHPLVDEFTRTHRSGVLVGLVRRGFVRLLAVGPSELVDFLAQALGSRNAFRIGRFGHAGTSCNVNGIHKARNAIREARRAGAIARGPV